MSPGRTDSDLDDVWSDESGELDHTSELTEFEFNPPKPKAQQERRIPLISDLEVPVLGALPEPDPDPDPDPLPPPPPPPSASPPTPPPPPRLPTPAPKPRGGSLEIGAVLVGASTTSLLTDLPPDKPKAPESNTRTIVADAEGAAIAHAVSRSLQTGVSVVNIPEVLEKDEVRKVVMGKRAEDAPPPPAVPKEEPEPSDPEDAPLELAYDPRQPESRSTSEPIPSVRPVEPIAQPQSSVLVKRLALVLLAIVLIAWGVRFFARS